MILCCKSKNNTKRKKENEVKCDTFIFSGNFIKSTTNFVSIDSLVSLGLMKTHLFTQHTHTWATFVQYHIFQHILFAWTTQQTLWRWNEYFIFVAFEKISRNVLKWPSRRMQYVSGSTLKGSHFENNKIMKRYFASIYQTIRIFKLPFKISINFNYICGLMSDGVSTSP